MGVLKYVFHPGRVIKIVEWEQMKRKIKSVGENCKIGLNFSIVGAEDISIGNNFIGGDNISLWAWGSYNGKERGQKPNLIIGDKVTITSNCVITCANKVTIGDGVLLGRGTFITDNSHGKNDSIEELRINPSSREVYSKGPVNIGRNVWTGTNVCIMPGVSIGDGAIIGANSVVTHDIPEAAVAVGAPARVVKIIGSESIKHED